MSRALKMTSIAALFFCAYTIAPLSAQEPAARDVVLTSIKASIVRAIGDESRTVKVTMTGNILMILRVNSNLNDTTHERRDNEAKTIVPIA